MKKATEIMGVVTFVIAVTMLIAELTRQWTMFEITAYANIISVLSFAVLDCKTRENEEV